MKLRYIGEVDVIRQGARIVCYNNGSVSLQNGECEVDGKLADELLERGDYEEIKAPGKPEVKAASKPEPKPVVKAPAEEEAAPVEKPKAATRKRRTTTRKKTTK